MRFGKILLAAAAVSMAATPALANPASSLSVSNSVRTGSSAGKKSELAGGGIIIAVLAVAAVVAGIVIIADDNDKADSN
jgi:SNF family Na+-dependent transporter